jgi:hypothetical protein
MQEVKNAVGKRDLSLLGGAPPARGGEGYDLAPRVEALAQKVPVACGLKRISRTKPGNSRFW